jgi:hypothetical protein
MFKWHFDMNQWHYYIMKQWFYANDGKMTWTNDSITSWYNDVMWMMVKWLESMTSCHNDRVTLYESWWDDMNQWYPYIMIQWLYTNHDEMTRINDIMTQWYNDYIWMMVKWHE